MANYLTLKNKYEMYALKNHKEGELVLLEDTHTYYVYKEDKWVEQTTDLSITLYEANLTYYEEQENLTTKQIKDGKKVIKEYVRKNPGTNFMFLNNEFRYYTIFQKREDGVKEIQNEVYDLLLTFDNIKCIRKNDEGLVEIWATFKGVLGLFMFFNYDEGVIACI